MKKLIRTVVYCVTVVSTAVCMSGCEAVDRVINCEAFDRAINGKHAILIVRLSYATYGTREIAPDMDAVLLRNVLSGGGTITCGCDHEYIEFLRTFDSNFDMAAAANKDGKFNVKSAILNWIASKGWVFQQKFCAPNARGGYAEHEFEYYFVK